MGKKGHCKRRGLYFLPWKRKQKSSIGNGIFCISQNCISSKDSTVFVSDRMSYIVLRGHWCKIIVLNVYAPGEEKSDD